ncbi:DUF5668 domain-containing protein [Mucilaginibacter sp. PAMB04168]|uniref:LiaF transmembrane domain-containing protein n=1 Tax=Mucilaginibacter sp. PAMB04168 TaxID=3138567 RepID=UPI0031F5F319
MSIEPSYPNSPQNNGKVFAGLILLAVGSLLLLHQFADFFFPSWLFSFPMLLIVIGLFVGFKNNFKSSAWLILVGIGVFFLSGRILPDFNLRAFFWPLAIIGVGLWLIVKRNHTPAYKKKWKADQFNNAVEADYVVRPDGSTEMTDAGTGGSDFTAKEKYTTQGKGDDVIEAVSVFGGIKKTILSKDFKGGEIINIFGGAELDFTRADINGIVEIEIVQIFGGVKLLVPPHWQVRSDVAAIFASVDDKRFGNATAQSSDKILVLKGTSIFAGVDVRSF